MDKLSAETNRYKINIAPKAILCNKSASGAKRIYILTIIKKSSQRMYTWQFDTIQECNEQWREFFECLDVDSAKEPDRLYASNL